MGMRPVTIEFSGAGIGPVIPLNWRKTPFQVTIECQVEGTLDYTVRWTADDIRSPDWNPATATWHAFDGLTGQTDDAVDSLDGPVRAISPFINSGDGTLRMNVISAGG